MLAEVFQADIDVLGLIKNIKKICIEFEKKIKTYGNKEKEVDINQLALF